MTYSKWQTEIETELRCIVLALRYTPSARIQNLDDIARPYDSFNQHSGIEPAPLLDQAHTACYKSTRRVFP